MPIRKSVSPGTLLLPLAGALLLAGCGGSAMVTQASAAAQQKKTYVVVKPGTHPGIVFSDQELPAMRKRAKSTGIAGDAYRKIRETALSEYDSKLTARQAVGREGPRLSRQLESMALVYQVEGDKQIGRKAVELFQSVATGIDPTEFYREVDSDFFATEHWPKAFAFAWDWLYPLMTSGERETVLKSLEQWSTALYDHTERSWWRDASYNCGAIPVGAQGMLLTAIQAETRHPDFSKWFANCFRKVKENYFPRTWRASGICNEGPGYAHYHKNPTQFLEGVRRTGGPDLIYETGAVNAMHYLRHQWLPQGGCGPVGDNTGYGRRVFQSIYLHGIRELRDRAGLWTFEKYTDRERINPIVLFLFYPDDLEPASPGALDLGTSFYFEIDPHRAGYLFSRNEWENEQASWFVFTTRYANANHTHYDMNSFLFTAFGEEFATHANVFPYGHEHHGVDFEHNIVIVDEGGMPAADRRNTAGDDGSIRGYMTGVGVGHFADYARGDARLSYADRSVRSSTPAIRADRSALFVKQGPYPYVVVADDIQKDEDREHDYHWQWYTQSQALSGEGTFDKPFLIEGANARCGIAFLDPVAPEHDFKVVKGGQRNYAIELGLLRVNLRGVRARYVAVGAAWRKDSPQPRFRRGPKVSGNPNAASLVVEGENFRDLILWQPEESADAPGKQVSSGELKTDALMALVRTDRAGNVVGYLMGDGTSVEFAGKSLARSQQAFSVSADSKRSIATGPRRARQGLEPLPVKGAFWLPDAASEVWADGERVRPSVGSGRMAILGSSGGH
jgi:hypothetical protein